MNRETKRKKVLTLLITIAISVTLFRNWDILKFYLFD
jgi:hypothetical protein